MASIDQLIALHKYQYGRPQKENTLMQAIPQILQTAQENHQKKVKSQVDMYQTLRDAGYNPQKAFEATQKGEFPDTPGEETIREKSHPAAAPKPESPLSFKDKISQKVANGETLTTGEQKVYDQVIKKRGDPKPVADPLAPKATVKTPASDAAALADTSAQDTADYIPMTDPSGKKKKVHKDDVTKALKAGWKKR